MKYTKYKQEVIEILIDNPSKSDSAIAREINKNHGLNLTSTRGLRKMIRNCKNIPELEIECIKKGIDVSTVKNYWYKGKHFSIHAANKQFDYHEIKDDIIADMKKHAPDYKKVKRDIIKDSHLLVLSPADVHIGKLAKAFETGEEYNSQIAVKRVLEGVQGIIQKSIGYPMDKILFVIGNDILHIDSPQRKTTSGTPQDTDGQWYDNFLMAKTLYVDIIETLMTLADVHIVFNRSNHDHMSGFFLADTIHSWFANCKNVTFDVSMRDRKYFLYGKNLIGTTHGDGAKIEALPLLMATEEPMMWSQSKHRYVYTHHVHHKVVKDMVGVTVESLRSPSSADAWHHRSGYQHNPKAIEGFIHHPEDGQIARFNHFF
jgi:hypothetical protein